MIKLFIFSRVRLDAPNRVVIHRGGASRRALLDYLISHSLAGPLQHFESDQFLPFRWAGAVD